MTGVSSGPLLESVQGDAFTLNLYENGLPVLWLVQGALPRESLFVTESRCRPAYFLFAQKVGKEGS